MIRVKVNTQSTVPVTLQRMDSRNVEAGKSITFIANPDYEAMKNKPSINGCILVGNKTNDDININGIDNIELDNIINSIF